MPCRNMNNNTWHFVCFTWNGNIGKVRFYHDGRQYGRTIQDTGTITRLQPGGYFTIGPKRNFSSRLLKEMDGFTGKMSQFNVWNSVLSYQSIQVMSAGGANVNGDLVSWRNVAEGIVGHIPLERSLKLFLPGKK